MENSNIEWTDNTFNPWIGCTKVSPGCANCYAETLMDTRYRKVQWGKGKPRQRTSAANWKQPLKWNRQAPNDIAWDDHRPRVFCASLADWLDDEVPIEWLADLLKLIHDTPNLDWLLLTKRPENWAHRLDHARAEMLASDRKCPEPTERFRASQQWATHWLDGQPPQNVWLGVSVEDQKRADERIPRLLQIPAKVRFLSCEPLLGPVDLDCLLPTVEDVQAVYRNENPEWPKIHWVIFGGESGNGARPCWVDHIRYGVAQCQAANVRVFIKQFGSNAVGNEMDKWVCRMRDKKGGDMSEWPQDLRVREFPQ